MDSKIKEHIISSFWNDFLKYLSSLIFSYSNLLSIVSSIIDFLLGIREYRTKEISLRTIEFKYPPAIEKNLTHFQKWGAMCLCKISTNSETGFWFIYIYYVLGLTCGKMQHFGGNKTFFQNIHYSHFCSQWHIVSYDHKIIQNFKKESKNTT